MAFLFITELSQLQTDRGGAPVADLDSVVAEQTVAIGAEGDSAVFNPATRYIRVNTDAVCSIKYIRDGSLAVAATTSTMRLSAQQTEYFKVTAGGKLSVISNT